MLATYIGQCGFILSHAGSTVVTDPYLTDRVDRLHYTPDTPWARAYPPPVRPEDLQCGLILLSHSHDDHTDPDTLRAYRKAGGSAVVACPAPEEEALSRAVPTGTLALEADRVYEAGGVRVLPIPCAHTEFHRDERGRYRELSYLIEFPDGARVFFGGDMTLYPGLAERLRELSCRLLFLPVNGRSEELTRKGIVGNMNAREAARLAAGLGVPFVPMHFDLYPFNGCPADEILAAAREEGACAHVPAPGRAEEFPL